LNTNIANPAQVQLLVDNGVSGTYFSSPAGPNIITFSNVVFYATGGSTPRVLRITGIRANAELLGLSSTSIPTQIVSYLSSSNPAAGIFNPQLTLATIQLTNLQISTAVLSTSNGSACVAPSASYTFAATEPQAAIWFEVTGVNPGDVPRMEWYAPNGSLYSHPSWSATTSGGDWCFWWDMNIAGMPPASMPGNWLAKVYWNSTPLFALNFQILGSGSGAGFDGNGVPDLVWQNDITRQVTVWHMGGTGGAVFQGWTYLSEAGVPGWQVVAVADFNGDGVPDLVWQNDTTRQVVVWYLGGGALFQGYNYLSPPVPGWRVVAAPHPH